MEKLRNIVKSMALICLLALFVGCATAPKAERVENPEDQLITKKVSAAIFHEPTLRTSQINVKTTNGVVKLTGVVEKALNVETATQIASSVPGVVQVKSELSVKE